MIKNGKGGANTMTGLIFEGKTDLATFINTQNNYKVVSEGKNIDQIFYKGK